MKQKSILILAVICAFTLGLFCSCGGSEAEDQTETTAATEATEAAAMSSDQLLKVITSDLGTDIGMLDDIQQGMPGDDGNITISFKISGTDCSYILNATTGEIVEKNVPEEALNALNEAGDPTQDAMNAAFDSIDGFDGNVENLTMSQEDSEITVEFDYHGEHVTKVYDYKKGELVD